MLTSAPTSDVTITITVKSDGLTTVDKTSLVFTPAKWNIPQTVTVTAVENPDVPENELKFSPADQRANVIKGPLTVWGGIKPDTIRTLAVPVTLPNEDNKFNPDGTVDSATPTTLIITPDGDGPSLEDIKADVEDFPGITFVAIIDEGAVVEQRLITEVDLDNSILVLDEPWSTDPSIGVEYVIRFRSRTLDAIEADQIDTLNVFNALSPSNEVGTLTKRQREAVYAR